MNSFVEKLKAVERDVAEERGGMTLFALFEHEELPGRWDLVLSAPWVGDSRRAVIEYILGKIRPRLDQAEFLSISRIVPLRPSEPFVKEVNKIAQVEHGLAELRDVVLNGMAMTRAYIITSRPEIDAPG